MQQIIIENGGTTGIANYSAVVAAVKERLSTYEGMVVLEDAIPQTKQEIADLRKVAKTASDLRISVKREHEAKISETINQLKEITDLYNDAANKLDSQVKEYELKAQQEKEAQIRSYWNEHVGKIGEFLSLDVVWNPKWLNKGYSMTNVMLDIDTAIETATKGVRTILGMKTPHQQTLLRTFFTTLDMQKVMEEKLALDEQTEKMADSPQESVPASQPTVEPVKQENAVEDDFKEYTLCFKVTATKKQIIALREFLIANNIKYMKGE